jgi:hypothetical protein
VTGGRPTPALAAAASECEIGRCSRAHGTGSASVGRPSLPQNRPQSSPIAEPAQLQIDGTRAGSSSRPAHRLAEYFGLTQGLSKLSA